MAHSMLKQACGGHRRPAVNSAESFALREVLSQAASLAGERLLTIEKGYGEFDSLDRSHVSSRNDLEGTALTIRYIPELLARAGLPFVVSFENEELPLVPLVPDGQRLLRLVIDPIDGTKAFDNYMCRADVSLPRPASAVSIAAICPYQHEIVATCVYCFDLGEAYSSFLLNPASDDPQYMAFCGDRLLSPLTCTPDIAAKRRILNGNYNSRALRQLAEVELALMDRGLNPCLRRINGKQRHGHNKRGAGQFCCVP